ncbi:MAG TPA: response regulator [Pirellulales bacterium]|jgi:CheY-like chemotaxis protein|nr:response regulator [Pirellulales bacterium]
MSKRVLLCDDEPYITAAARFKLSQAGYDVECACDGQAGWEAIQRQRPDVLVTDCQMPQMDGLQLIARVRSVAELANLPIFLLTGKGMELPHAELKLRWGLRAVLDKPFSPKELVRHIDEALADQSAAAATP